MNKTISFIIPTVGRGSLMETLASIETLPGDEILIIRQPLPLPWDAGSGGRNTGMAKATGDYIAFIDDDDIYYPGHRGIMEDAMQANEPVLFRFRYESKTIHPNSPEVLWDDPVLRCFNVGTASIFFPNDKSKLIPWITDPKDKSFRVADFQFINQVRWPHRKLVFRPEIITLVRQHDDSKIYNND